MERLLLSPPAHWGQEALTSRRGLLQAANTTRTLNNAVQITGNFATSGTQGLILAGTVNLNGASRTLDLAVGAPLTLGGAVSNGGIIKTGAGQLTLSGANSYSGLTTVSAGTLLIGAANTLPSGTAVTVGSSGATSNPGLLNLNGTAQTISSLTLLGGNTSAANSGAVTIGSGGVLTVTGTIAYETVNGNRYPSLISGGTLNLGEAVRTFSIYNNGNSSLGGDLEVTSVIESGGINKTQTGLLRLSGANTLSGDVTVSAGTLILNNVNALQNSTLNTGTSGSNEVLFALAGNNTYNLGGLAGADALAIGGNTISVGSNGAGSTFSAGISGGGSIRKSGGGTLELSANNGYSGTTTITAGILELSGVSGAISGTTGISISGGTLLLSGSSTNRVATAPFALEGTATNSKLQTSAAVTETFGALSITGSGSRVIDFGGAGSKLTFTGAVPNSATVLNIWNWSGSTSGNGTDQLLFTLGTAGTQYNNINFFSGDDTNPQPAIGGGGGILVTNGGNVELVPVPEVGAVFGALALLAPLAFRERRHWMRCREARA